jgi:hypothetical protein
MALPMLGFCTRPASVLSWRPMSGPPRPQPCGCSTATAAGSRRDLSHHRRRAGHRGQDEEVVANAYAAVGASPAFEGEVVVHLRPPMLCVWTWSPAPMSAVATPISSP